MYLCSHPIFVCVVKGMKPSICASHITGLCTTSRYEWVIYKCVFNIHLMVFSCYMYRIPTFQRKELSFIGSGSLLFPHEYTDEGRDAEGVEDLPVYECEKRSFPYSIMPSSFVWNVRYLTCTIIELVNKMKYACFCFVRKINLYFKGTPDLHQGGNYK